MHRKRIMVLVVVVAVGTTTASAAPYVPALERDNMTFPVARSKWYSVINFSNDWHAPRMRKIDGRWRQVGVHEGTDIFAEPGTPIRAVAPGRVENIGWLFYSGWRVGVRAPDGRYWFYAHMSRFAPGLSEGDLVDTGDELGAVGNTGYGTRPGHHDEFTYHLHLGIQAPDGTWVNPYPLVRKLYRQASKAPT